MKPRSRHLRAKGDDEAPGFRDHEDRQEQYAKAIGGEQFDDDEIGRRDRRVAGKDQEARQSDGKREDERYRSESRRRAP